MQQLPTRKDQSVSNVVSHEWLYTLTPAVLDAVLQILSAYLEDRVGILVWSHIKRSKRQIRTIS